MYRRKEFDAFLQRIPSKREVKENSCFASAGRGLPIPAGFDIDELPFVRDSSNGGNLASLDAVGSSVLVVPTHNKTLVRTVSQRNSVSRRREVAHFVVPAATNVRGRTTRFAESSLEIPAFGGDRLAPEYVNIRHEVDPTGPASQTPTDLNTLNERQFDKAMEDGGYAAAHFTDDSCDGCLECEVSGLDPTPRENFPAFSLITAVDFMPLADQSELDADGTIRQVQPLSTGRLPVNPTLPRPSNPTSRAFARNDTTVTALVGNLAAGPRQKILGRANRMVSYLPDSASNVFAPGWDTSRSRDAVGIFLTSSGLGSPFPEDAKLCSALASFWPAVAPDNGRTFGNQGFGNQVPMLDQELGLHPNHDLVSSGANTSFRGWDGEFGPFFESVSGQLHVNYATIKRSDYVSHALASRIQLALTAEIQSEELIRRNQAPRFVPKRIASSNQRCMFGCVPSGRRLGYCRRWFISAYGRWLLA